MTLRAGDVQSGRRLRVATAWLVAGLVLLLASSLVVKFGASLATVISGEHMRRQADTFSVAEHFLSFPNFFYPRVYDTRGGPGIYGMEAPIVPYAISLGLRLFGREEQVGRWVVLALSLPGVVAMAYHLRRSAAGAWLGLLVGLLLSPMTLFYLRQGMPDLPMAALGALGLVLAYESRTRGPVWAGFASACFALGVLTKYPLVFVYPAFVLALWQPGSTPRRWLRDHSWRLVMPLLLLGLWMLWSEHINSAYGGGRRYFHSTPDLHRIIRNVREFELGGVLRRVVFRYALVRDAVPIAVIGTLAALAGKERARAACWFLWLFGCLLLFVTYSHKLESHYYYAVLLLPAVWYFTALGVGGLFDLLTLNPGQELPTRLAGGVGLAGLVLMRQSWPLAARLLGVGLALGIMIAGPRLRRWRRPLPALLALTALGLGPLLYGALKTSEQAFDNRTKRAEAPNKTRARRDELRKLVAAHTRSRELVVAISEWQQEPWPLLAARRHGWADHARHVTRRALQPKLDAGARWLIISPQAGPQSRRVVRRLPKSTLVGRSRHFRLYALPKVLATKSFR